MPVKVLVCNCTRCLEETKKKNGVLSLEQKKGHSFKTILVFNICF